MSCAQDEKKVITMLRNLLFALLLPLCASGVEFTFSKGSGGWKGDFADYPVGEDQFYELSWGWENLPLPIDSLSKGLYLNGNNHSDDLFMFVKRKIEGLRPNTLYALNFRVLIESNTPEQGIGIGGAPGESLFVKVGASPFEPHKRADQGFYYLNVDKGNQGQGGRNAHVIGNLANALVDPDKLRYQPKELCSQEPLMMKSDANGSMWIFIGTDSGYEGPTRFYIAKIELELVQFKDF